MSDEWQIAIEIGGNDVLLFDGETTLGRNDESDVVIADSSVSRQHAVIRVDGKQVSIRDLGSSNGTLVGDEEIEGQVDLHDGDRIQLGDRLAILRIRSLLSDLEGASSALGGGEPAVGSATKTLQKASLDLAGKAQSEGFQDEVDPALHRRPTEIRPLSIPDPIQPPTQARAIDEEVDEDETSPVVAADPAESTTSATTDLRDEVAESTAGEESTFDPSTMWVPAMDLHSEVAAAADRLVPEIDENSKSTHQIPPEDLRVELEVDENPAETERVSPEALQTEQAALEGPASTMEVPIAHATEPETDEAVDSLATAAPIPESADPETRTPGGLLKRIQGWFSPRRQ